MADAVELAIKLRDQVSGPARKAQDSLAGIRREADGLKNAGAGANRLAKQVQQFTDANGRLRDMRGRFVGGGGGARGGGGILGGLGLGASVGGGLALGAGLAGMLSGAARAALDLGMALAKVAANAALAFGKAVAGAALFREKAEGAFRLLGHGKFNAADQLDRVKKLAQELGLPFEDAIGSFKHLLAMQFTPKAAEDVIKMTSDLRAIGADADQVKRSIMAMTQIKAKGRLQTEELLQLAEAGVSLELVMGQLSKATGKSGDDLRKLLETGKITGEQGLAAIGEAIKQKVGIKNFGDAGRAFATETIAGMVERLKNLKSFLLDDIVKRIKPAFESLKPIFNDIMAAFESPAAAKALDAVAAVINGLVATVKAAWPIVKAFGEGVGKGFVQGWDAAQKGLQAFSKGAGGNKQMIADLTVVARAAGQALGLMAASLAAVAAGLANAEKAARLAFEPLNKISGLGSMGMGGKGKDGGVGGLFGMGGGLIPTASSLLGNQLAGGFGEMGNAEVNTSNTLTVSVSGVGKTDQELANLIRREAERIFTQKLASLPI